MALATPTVVLLPIWPAGHLVSLLDAGKRLLARSGDALSLTVLVIQPPAESDRAELAAHIRREEASGLDIRSHQLPAVEPPAGCMRMGPEEFISRFIELHAEHVKAAISALTCPVAAVVLDFFGTTMLDVCRELCVPAYVYFTADAALYALMLRLPTLHEEVAVEFGEMEGMVDVPGLPPVPPSCFPVGMMDKKDGCYTWFMYHGRRFAEADGVIINTAAELEQSILASIAADDNGPTLYPVGPMLSFPPTEEQRQSPCMQWLDTQPPASVVLLCFGSAGFFTAEQAHQVADGLERSGHRFLWVLRGPPEADTPLTPTDAVLGEMLPEGFLERTKHKGLVWPTKAPQKEILAHAAVGGFVTHGGWNSTLESLWFGVPMVPWPLYSEQHLNAFTLVAYMGVAVAMEVDRKRNNYVEAAELERAIKALMDADSDDGRKARGKAIEMKAACRKAVHESGGSSYAALAGSPTIYRASFVSKFEFAESFMRLNRGCDQVSWYGMKRVISLGAAAVFSGYICRSLIQINKVKQRSSQVERDSCSSQRFLSPDFDLTKPQGSVRVQAQPSPDAECMAQQFTQARN